MGESTVDDIIEAILEFLVDVFSNGIWRDLNRWVGKFVRPKVLRILICVLILILMTAVVAGFVALLLHGISAVCKAIT